MAQLNKIVEFLNQYLEINNFKDSSWNGLQLEGAQEINTIVFAVDAGIETFKQAAEKNAQMVVVHHGQFWAGNNPSITGWTNSRLNQLWSNDISLYASHLPLDKHKDVGNNAQLLKILGASIKEEFGKYNNQNIGWIGELKVPTSIKEIELKLSTELGTTCKLLNFGREKVKRIAVCSGGGSTSFLTDAINMGADLYLTGEHKELYHTAKDGNINVIFAGHHASETVGVKALAEVVKKKFNVDTIFIDIATGL